MADRSPLTRFLLGGDALAPVAVDLGLLLLRVGFGLTMLLAHGQGKLSRLLSENPQFADPLGLGAMPTLGLAVLAEYVCSALVTVGFLTRAAILPLVATMSTAFFVAHADDPFPTAERSFLFLIAFVGLFFTGPGRFSVDGWLLGRGSANAARP